MTETHADRPTDIAPGVVRWALEESYRGPAWHGPSVLTALKGVSAADASWRPAEGRNCIWELTLHLAYARHRVLGRLARLSGRRAGRFTRRRDPEWFPLMPEPADASAWRADKELLESSQQALLQALEKASPTLLARRRRGAGRTLGQEIIGLALHDTYHAGQIRLLAKLVKAGAPRLLA